MAGYALKRLLVALLVALAVSVISFALLRISGDVAAALAGEGATAADIEFVRQAYGLDRPLPVQYLDWLGRTLQGDFGQSLYFKQDVASLVLTKLPTTLILGAISLAFALALSIPLGVAAAVYPNSWIDRLALLLAVIGQALPNFWFALMLIMLFSLTLRLLPVSGSETWAHFVMPAHRARLLRGARVHAADPRRHDRGARRPTTSARRARTGSRPARWCSSTRCATRSSRWSRSPRCSSASCSAARSSSKPCSRSTGSATSPGRAISHKDFPVIQAIVLLLSMFYVGLTLAADLANALARSAHPREVTMSTLPLADTTTLDAALTPGPRHAPASARPRPLWPRARARSPRRDPAPRPGRAAARAVRSLRAGPPARLIPPIWYPGGRVGAPARHRRPRPRLPVAASSMARAISLLIGVSVMLISGMIGTALGIARRLLRRARRHGRDLRRHHAARDAGGARGARRRRAVRRLARGRDPRARAC